MSARLAPALIPALVVLALAVPAGADSGHARSRTGEAVDEDILRSQVVAPSASASASALVNYARLLFGRQDYPAAAEALERAYAREPRPIFLFNAAQSYRKAERYADATRCYERFLIFAPKHALAVEARDHLRTLQVLQEQQQKRREIELEVEQTHLQLEREKSTPVYKRPWFWIALGSAVAGTVGVVVGIKIYRDQRDSNTGTLSLQF
jgi:tetratricopeptide (TPR) repeat protein